MNIKKELNMLEREEQKYIDEKLRLHHCVGLLRNWLHETGFAEDALNAPGDIYKLSVLFMDYLAEKREAKDAEDITSHVNCRWCGQHLYCLKCRMPQTVENSGEQADGQ